MMFREVVKKFRTQLFMSGIPFLLHSALDSALAQDCLIIANGPPLKQSIVETLAQGKRIVALDGAVHTLRTVYRDPLDPKRDPIVPAVILGDFDSSQEEDRTYFKTAKIIRIEDQDTTDLEKGIENCIAADSVEIWIVNALGLSRMDHTLANLNILKKYSRRASLHLVSENELTEYVEDKTLRFTGKIKQAVGVFGFPEARVTSTGLQYPMHDTEVVLGKFFSSSNYISENEVTLKITGQAFVTYPFFLLASAGPGVEKK